VRKRKGQPGGVEVHPQRRQIEVELASRVPLRLIGARYGLSKDQLHRHRKAMPADLLARLRVTPDPEVMDPEALKRSESQSLLAHLIAERVRQQRIADEAERLGDLGLACKASGAVVGTLTQAAKILGDLPTGRTVVNQTFLLSADWVELRRVILTALRPHREAAQAVAQALRAHEQREAHVIEGEARSALPAPSESVPA
jgi:hypothetical protein